MFLSLGIRFIASIEALNMAETIGNLSKHRKAPVVVRTQEGYRVVYVPAISGESIAHAYQANIVELAKKLYDRPPLDEWSLRGEFFKFMDNRHLTPSLQGLAEKLKVKSGDLLTVKHEFEKTAIKDNIIADIGGFLYAEAAPVKRTSAFQVGYAVPVTDALEATVIESQLHVRHAPAESVAEPRAPQEEEERAAQMLYYVETGTAVYGLTFNLDLDKIGRTSLIKVEDAMEKADRAKRIKIALLALAETLSEGGYGAKRSRFLPISSIESLGVALTTTGTFTISPPHEKAFIKKTLERSKSYVELLNSIGLSTQINIYAYAAVDERIDGVHYYDSPEALFKALIDALAPQI